MKGKLFPEKPDLLIEQVHGCQTVSGDYEEQVPLNDHEHTHLSFGSCIVKRQP
jgi:hypothetical protein